MNAASEFDVTRWLRASLLLVWCCFVVVNSWAQTETWYGFLAEAALMIAAGYAGYWLVKAFAALVSAAIVNPILWLLPRSTTIHGSARWQRRREILDGNLSRVGKIYLGGYRDWRGQLHPLTTNGGEHVLVVGSSRSGKGAGVLVPSLLDWRHSVIAYDEKAELHRLTSGWRAGEAGNAVYRFEPASATCSCQFNFLSAVRLGSAYETADILNLVFALTEGDEPYSGESEHWVTTARDLLGGAIAYVLQRNKAASFADVLLLLSNPTQAASVLFDEMVRDAHPLVAGSGRAMLNRSDKERSGILSTAIRFLALWRDPVIARNTASSSFALRELADGEKPLSLYIVTQPADAVRLRPLVRMLLTTAFQHLMSVPLEFNAAGKPLAAHRHQVLIAADEFASLKRMEIVESSLARCLGYGVTALIAVQDISQLHRGYGEHQNVSNNANLRVCFPPNETATAEWISRQLGTTTVSTEMLSTSSSWRGIGIDGGSSSKSYSTQHTARQLLLADEILALPKPLRDDGGQITAPGQLIVLEAGKRGVLAEQLLYWQDAELLRRSRLTPAGAETPAETATLSNVVPFPKPKVVRVPDWAVAAAGVALFLLASCGAVASYVYTKPTMGVAARSAGASVADIGNTAAGIAGIATPTFLQPSPAQQQADEAQRQAAAATRRADSVRQFCQKMAVLDEGKGVLYPNQCRQAHPEFLKSAR